MSLLGSTNYRVWLRMRAPSVYGEHTNPSVTLAPVSHPSIGVGDLVIVSTWSRGTTAVPTHTLQAGFTQLVSQAHDDGNLDGRLSVAYRVATVAGAVPYQAYTSSAGTNYSGLTVIRAGQYSLTGILAASTNNTGDTPPNPPSAGTLVAPSVVFAIGAWHLSGNTVSVSPPSNYTELWEMSGSHNGELSVATRILASGAVADPGAFGDNVTPNGTASATIAIRLTSGVASNSVWVGLNAGTSAGAANTGNVATTVDEAWQWVVSPQLTSGAAGVHTFSIYTREDGVLVDAIAVSQQSTNSPTFDNSWAYQNNPRTPQPQTCNADDYDTNAGVAGDQDDILADRRAADVLREQGRHQRRVRHDAATSRSGPRRGPRARTRSAAARRTTRSTGLTLQAELHARRRRVLLPERRLPLLS